MKVTPTKPKKKKKRMDRPMTERRGDEVETKRGERKKQT